MTIPDGVWCIDSTVNQSNSEILSWDNKDKNKSHANVLNNIVSYQYWTDLIQAKLPFLIIKFNKAACDEYAHDISILTFDNGSWLEEK
jgi:hypothetical protein